MTTAAAPSLRPQQFRCGDHAVGPEDGLEVLDAVVGHARPGAVVGVDDRAVRRGDRGDLAAPEAVRDGLLRQVLRADAEQVELAAAESAHPGDVFSGLAHGHVDVGQVTVLSGVVPVLTGRVLIGAALRRSEDRVPRRGVVGGPAPEPGDGLHAGRDEHVPLAGPDGVERHPGGLHRGGAVAGDGRSGHSVHAVEDVDDPGHVVPGLSSRETAAEVEVPHRVLVQSGDLVEGRLDDERGEVVGPQLGQRALVGTADGRAGDGHDHCFGHVTLSWSGRPLPGRRADGGGEGVS